MHYTCGQHVVFAARWNQLSMNVLHHEYSREAIIEEATTKSNVYFILKLIVGIQVTKSTTLSIYFRLCTECKCHSNAH